MADNKVELVCIACPVGCLMEVEQNGDEFIVTGNACKRGPEYAKAELTHPTRTLCTTVAIKNGFLNRVPVFTEDEIPKGLIFEAMDEINKIVVEAPVKVRQIVIENLLGTGINVVTTRSMSKKNS
ncbi:DUF1667 domain-containing protein [Petrocella sp. FN5]|uniref:DUF1667 domain-containing protein n=1 Tax=Petrocella sp. FN5 TaxID=3032002 RepID=UPI0023DA4BD0|nr:DUF1667 domain-containing protein [Petrocella sp. FN5]MDF1615896.1 DUF1667 domain-containing protein [Petrocella sp. FN5]